MSATKASQNFHNLAADDVDETNRQRECLMRVRKSVVAGLAVATIALGAVPAMAQESSPSTTIPPAAELMQKRIDVACARVPVATDRVEKLLARLQGGPDVAGSIEWLQAKADDANQHGRDKLASLISGRIEIRTERIDVLEARLDWLGEVASLCEGR
jgi:hypothetical protein